MMHIANRLGAAKRGGLFSSARAGLARLAWCSGGLALLALLLLSHSSAAHIVGIRAGRSADAQGRVSLRLLIATDAPAGRQLQVTVPSDRGANVWTFVTDAQGSVDTGPLYADGSMGGRLTVTLGWDDGLAPRVCLIQVDSITTPASRPEPVLCAGLLRVPEDFPTIGQAVAAARGGETLLIEAGHYLTNLNIAVALTLRSQSGSRVILEGGSLDQPVITVGSAGVHLAGLIVQASQADETAPVILAVGGAALTLERSTVAAAGGPALELRDLAQLQATNSQFSGRGSVTLRAEGSTRLTLNNCQISGSNFAVVLIGDRAQATIDNCSFHGHLGRALLIEGSASASVLHNNFSQNNQAIELFGDALASLTGNLLTHNQQGLRVGGDAQATLTANRISDNSQSGILLATQARALIWNNTINGNGGWGIALLQRPCFSTDAKFIGQVSGGGNKIFDNAEGKLCPPANQYAWPSGFITN